MAQNTLFKPETGEANLSKIADSAVGQTQMATSSENQVGGKQINEMRQSQASTQATDALPALNLNSTQEKPGYFAVAKEIAKGAVNELVDHPGRVLGNAAMGVAIGVGTALAAPEIAFGAAAVGVGAAAYGAYKYGAEWINSAKIVADPSGKSEAEQMKAKQTLQDVGGGATDIIAGGMAGMGAAMGTTAIKNGATKMVSKMVEKAIEVVSFGKNPAFEAIKLPSPAVQGVEAAAVTSGVESTRRITSW